MCQYHTAIQGIASFNFDIFHQCTIVLNIGQRHAIWTGVGKEGCD